MLNRLYSWYGKKTVWAVAAVVLILVVSGIVVAQNANQNGDATEEQLPVVKVATVQEIASKDSITLIGTVRAVDEAQLQSEVGGRVTSVTVALGDYVQAGQILGQQENAAQRAAVLQAQGAYEAALASAQQGSVSIDEAQNAVTSAKNSLIAADKSAYTTASGVLLNTIDDFFANPESTLPGLRISGKAYTQTLNAERYALNQTMQSWKMQTNTATVNSNVQQHAQIAQENIKRVLTIVDILIELVNAEDTTTTLNGVAIESYNAILLADRTSLNSALTSLQSGITTLNASQEALNKAQIGGGSQESSVANAQVKQALGSLRAAQANLEKTIFRTPIAGTINALSVHVGDYIGAFTNVAKVANNNALEISTFVGETDLNRITVGQTVVIEGNYEGVVTNVAPGIDTATQKSEVKIATETSELTNGDTVSIVLTAENLENQIDTLLLPITAIKFNAENGSVYTVEEQVLVAHEVTLGKLKGSFIEVHDGVDPSFEIVLDARGLSAGAKVSVTK